MVVLSFRYLRGFLVTAGLKGLELREEVDRGVVSPQPPAPGSRAPLHEHFLEATHLI